jgi:hypothetical protein
VSPQKIRSNARGSLGRRTWIRVRASIPQLLVDQRLASAEDRVRPFARGARDPGVRSEALGTLATLRWEAGMQGEALELQEKAVRVLPPRAPARLGEMLLLELMLRRQGHGVRADRVLRALVGVVLSIPGGVAPVDELRRIRSALGPRPSTTARRRWNALARRSWRSLIHDRPCPASIRSRDLDRIERAGGMNRPAEGARLTMRPRTSRGSRSSTGEKRLRAQRGPDPT